MTELAVWRKPAPLPAAQPFRMRPTVVGSVSDSVSSLIVRGSLSADTAERAACASSIATLGGATGSRLAFKSALRKAASESIDRRQLANALSRAARGAAADSLFFASLDVVRDGPYGASKSAGAIAVALARNLSGKSVDGAVSETLRLLRSPSREARGVASALVVALCRHPLTDVREVAELSYDSGTSEGREAEKAALMLPQKVIDMPAGDAAA